MTSYSAALELLQTAADAQEHGKHHEWVSLNDSVHRVAAAPYKSTHSTPRHDTSAMDGFVICSDATRDASPEKPVVFQKYGTIFAGERQREVKAAEFYGPIEPCFEIMTGGIFPDVMGWEREFDACVRFEDTEEVEGTSGGGRGLIAVTKPVSAGRDKRPAGSDITQGMTIIQPGRVIELAHMMALSSLGVSRLLAFKKPCVGVWSTGPEVGSGEHASIPDTNGPFLMSALRQAGAEPVFLGILPDDAAEIERAIQEETAEPKHDILITSGGVSAGRHDFVSSSVLKIGAEKIFHSVNVRPGHPILFAELPKRGGQAQVPFFGLPGNPGATAACFKFFVEPFMRMLQGMPPENPILAKLRDKQPQVHNNGMNGHGGGCNKHGSSRSSTLFRHGILQQLPDGTLEVQVNADQSPSKLAPYISANCWVRMEAGVSEGAPLVPCFPISGMGWLSLDAVT